MIYRKHYRNRILDQLWNKSSKLGFSLKECIQLTAQICQDLSEDVLRASFRLTKLKKFAFLESQALSDDDESELNEISNEVEEDFDPNIPLRVPFECEFCDFMTKNAESASEHRQCHPSVGTVKLHVGGINMNGNAEEFADLFRKHTTVHEHHLISYKELSKLD